MMTGREHMKGIGERGEQDRTVMSKLRIVKAIIKKTRDKEK